MNKMLLVLLVIGGLTGCPKNYGTVSLTMQVVSSADQELHIQYATFDTLHTLAYYPIQAGVPVRIGIDSLSGGYHLQVTSPDDLTECDLTLSVLDDGKEIDRLDVYWDGVFEEVEAWNSTEENPIWVRVRDRAQLRWYP